MCRTETTAVTVVALGRAASLGGTRGCCLSFRHAARVQRAVQVGLAVGRGSPQRLPLRGLRTQVQSAGPIWLPPVQAPGGTLGHPPCCQPLLPVLWVIPHVRLSEFGSADRPCCLQTRVGGPAGPLPVTNTETCGLCFSPKDDF